MGRVGLGQDCMACVIANEVIDDSLRAACSRELGLLEPIMKDYGDGDDALLRCHLDGTWYTQNGRANFQQDVDSKCPWCDAKNGFIIGFGSVSTIRLIDKRFPRTSPTSLSQLDLRNLGCSF